MQTSTSYVSLSLALIVGLWIERVAHGLSHRSPIKQPLDCHVPGIDKKLTQQPVKPGFTNLCF